MPVYSFGVRVIWLETNVAILEPWEKLSTKWSCHDRRKIFGVKVTSLTAVLSIKDWQSLLPKDDMYLYIKSVYGARGWGTHGISNILNSWDYWRVLAYPHTIVSTESLSDACLMSVGYLPSFIIPFENRTVKLSQQCLPSVHLAYDALWIHMMICKISLAEKIQKCL